MLITHIQRFERHFRTEYRSGIKLIVGKGDSLQQIGELDVDQKGADYQPLFAHTLDFFQRIVARSHQLTFWTHLGHY